MKFKRYIPIAAILAVLITLVGAQTFLARDPVPDSPQIYQSQVSNVGNSLENITRFSLDIELTQKGEVKVHYAKDQKGATLATVHRSTGTDLDGVASDDKAVQEIKTLLQGIPSLDSNEPLTLIKAVLDQFEIAQTVLREFEMDWELADGTRRNIDLDIDDDD